ncbi:hypothetical protein [Phenylobacterium sp.]|uniref:hypothetical protein n=1 Tax=Phenylobacterium sp. TaxID=1871053 RepID=UPI002DE503DC|nr:hypothetical protein [Phenylobacterium sp.]
MIKTSAALMLGLLLVGGCSGQPKSTASSDPYAGLDDAIRSWKTEVAASDISCKRAPAGSKCEMFDISCKAQRTITPQDQAKGVTAKLVADMSWSGYDDKGAPTPASAAALFTRAKGVWARTQTKAVDPVGCADLASK